MKVKFKSGADLPIKKTLKLYNMLVVVRTVFLEDNRYYPQVFLGEFLYKS